MIAGAGGAKTYSHQWRTDPLDDGLGGSGVADNQEGARPLPAELTAQREAEATEAGRGHTGCRPAPARRPRQGFIRADKVTRTYVPRLTGPVGKIISATHHALAAALRTEMDLLLTPSQVRPSPSKSGMH